MNLSHVILVNRQIRNILQTMPDNSIIIATEHQPERILFRGHHLAKRIATDKKTGRIVSRWVCLD